MDDLNVQIIDMDTAMAERVTLNADGSYTIFLNARLNHEQQISAYEHALEHINNCDFEKHDVQEIEYAAHHLQPAKVPQAPGQKRQKPHLPKKSTPEDWKKVERVVALHEYIAAQRGMDYFDYLLMVAEDRKLYRGL